LQCAEEDRHGKPTFIQMNFCEAIGSLKQLATSTGTTAAKKKAARMRL
jgi:hypothetical protein